MYLIPFSSFCYDRIFFRLTFMPGNLPIYALLRPLRGLYVLDMIVKKNKVQVIAFVHVASLDLVRKELKGTRKLQSS